MQRLTALVAAALVTVSLASASTGTSSAAFTSVSTSTGTVTAAVDWTPPTVSLAPPAEHVADTVALTVDAADGETGVREVVVEARPAGGAWMPVGSRTSEPWEFAWDTAPLADGPYELRATATDGVGLSTTTDPVPTTVLNTVTVTLATPATLVRGTASATADVTGLGITGVRFEGAPAGSTSWQQIGSAGAAPYGIEVDTTTVPDGRYDLRAVTTGRVTQPSAVVRGVVVDNTAPTVSLSVPGGPLRGTVPVSTSASDANGVAEVTLQSAPAGTGEFTDVSVTTAAAHQFALDTTQMPEGRYDLRAVARDAAGNEAATAATTHVVDNHRPRGVDVQAVDGGGTPGLIERGDVMTFTFSEEIALDSVKRGWSGEPTGVRVHVSNLSLLQGNDDVVEVVGAELGSIRTGADHVGWLQTRRFDATMTATTEASPDGGLRTVVRVELGRADLSLIGGRTTGPSTLRWNPSGAVRDLAGSAATTDVVVESGATDVDF